MARKFALFCLAFAAGMTLVAPTAAACGFLVADNGAVRLVRTSTFVAWDGEIERYITNFEFSGPSSSFGSITPLPGEPTHVGKAGNWTLQRLDQEVRPPAPRAAEFGVALESADAGSVEVILETQVDSLDITVLKGGGADVAAWADENGFDLGDEADELLDFYSDRSPYFMAARFDVERAATDEFSTGDGVPVLVEVPVERPWVPLHILGFDRNPDDRVEADVFLLTPDRPTLVHGVGLTVNRSEAAGDLLLDDLRSDENMEWVPTSGWFTHLELDVRPADLTYDLSVGADGVEPSMLAAGLLRHELSAEQLAGFGLEPLTDDTPWPAIAVAAAAIALVAGAAGARLATRGSASSSRS